MLGQSWVDDGTKVLRDKMKKHVKTVLLLLYILLLTGIGVLMLCSGSDGIEQVLFVFGTMLASQAILILGLGTRSPQHRAPWYRILLPAISASSFPIADTLERRTQGFQ